MPDVTAVTQIRRQHLLHSFSPRFAMLFLLLNQPTISTVVRMRNVAAPTTTETVADPNSSAANGIASKLHPVPMIAAIIIVTENVAQNTNPATRIGANMARTESGRLDRQSGERNIDYYTGNQHHGGGSYFAANRGSRSVHFNVTTQKSYADAYIANQLFNLRESDKTAAAVIPMPAKARTSQRNSVGTEPDITIKAMAPKYSAMITWAS